MVLAALILAWFGLSFGSFVNALVWRVHEQSKKRKSKSAKVNLSIVNGRSICPHCKHMLAWYDLVPVFSWLFLRGRCRYCNKAIAVASGIFWLLFVVSRGKWIGYGDVRLGLITGTILADPTKSFMMIIFGSLLGTLFILPALALGKKNMASKLPYGPFLIASTMLVLLFGDKILNWYTNFLSIG
jgi:prepilin signal peptidase PulO-like enzyme (type II secretory pathway)